MRWGGGSPTLYVSRRSVGVRLMEDTRGSTQSPHASYFLPALPLPLSGCPQADEDNGSLPLLLSTWLELGVLSSLQLGLVPGRRGKAGLVTMVRGMKGKRDVPVARAAERKHTGALALDRPTRRYHPGPACLM